MNVKILIGIVVILVILGGVFYVTNNRYSSYDYETTFPPEPTDKEIERVRNLPREECPCWVGGDDPDAYCGPQQWCI